MSRTVKEPPESARQVTARVLGFPFRGGALAAAVVFSVLLLLAAKAGLFGLWLMVVLGYGYLSYCFHLLEAVATGRPEPPVLAIDMMNPAGDWRPLALAVIASVYLGIWSLAGAHLPPGLAAAVGLVMIAMLPGAAVVLALEGSLARTLNPLVLLGAAWSLGLHYLAALLAAGLDGLVVGTLVATNQSALLWIFLLLMGVSLVASILGGGLYWRRTALNVPTVSSPERTRAVEERERRKRLSQFLDEVYREVRGDERQRAYQMLRDYLAKSKPGLQGWQEIFESVCGWHDPPLIRLVGQDYLLHMLQAGETSRAVDVVGQCLSIYPDFRPRDGADALRLARLARLAGRHAVARALLRDFDHNYPGHPGSEMARNLVE